MKTPQELKCIRLMNAELFEDEPQYNISLLSKHLFDVCGTPYKRVNGSNFSLKKMQIIGTRNTGYKL